AVIAGLILQADMAAGVEIDPHPPFAHGAVGLRSPGTPRLAVTTRRCAEDAFDVVKALALTAIKLGDPLIPAKVREIKRRRRLHAVIVGMVADLVRLERLDHVMAAALLKGACLLADNLECA